MLRGKLAAGLLAGTAAALVLGGCSAVNWASSEQFADSHGYQGAIDEVRFDNNSGAVSISVGDATTVHREVRYRGTKPGDTVTESGSVLTVHDCGSNCSVEYGITVPRGTKVDGSVSSGVLDLSGVASVDVQASSGKVTASHVPGPVLVDTSSGAVVLTDVGSAQVHASSGDVTVDGDAGPLTVQSQSGSVNATGLRGARSDVRASSGQVVLATAMPQDVDIQSASGAIELTVPAGSYRVSTQVGKGQADVRVPNDPGGTHSLSARTDNGDVRISQG